MSIRLLASCSCKKTVDAYSQTRIEAVYRIIPCRMVCFIINKIKKALHLQGKRRYCLVFSKALQLLLFQYRRNPHLTILRHSVKREYTHGLRCN